ncbi:hypothetical protein GA0061099_10303 [Bradyrhizobium yuanmingense]|uniref:Lectin-like protein BA14k n=1 Tax=Bradyrhizobium yuanmingense TaxID=108015 RepID=A0A1C3XJ00_9BRAD|nr:hypothetical protein [Bradyrhizobium yuanmingense]TWI17754.1 hypothetical protein IQ15_07344 [Bradyrhizobium yuanmingense]SCB52240.1 hypothetical protein GA0061099_10303 [Bradyrhizobium yuanmingense]
MALTSFKIITGLTALWSLMLVAAIQRDATAPPVVAAEEPQQSTPKADRLPLFIVVDRTDTPAQAPTETAERGREHKRHDICEHGRRYFRIGRHQYWHCRRR